MTDAAKPEIPAQPRWDPLVRLAHWGIVVGVLVNGVLTDDGGLVHLLFGWTVLALLALRLAWGVIGPSHARFTSFPPNPRAALAHLVALVRDQPKPTRSHNPAGALMAYALWASLAVVTATGVGMTGIDGPIVAARDKAAVAAGDWQALAQRDHHGAYHEDGDDLSDTLEEVHEMAANTVLLLALLHVVGVALESRTLGQNLLRGMITGRKP